MCGMDKEVNIVRSFYNCLNSDGFTELDTFVGLNLILNTSEIGRFKKQTGYERFQKLISKYKVAFSGFSIELKDVFSNGQALVCFTTLNGTNKGENYGYFQNNEPFSINGFDLIRIENDKIVEITRIYDTYKLLKDLHLIDQELEISEYLAGEEFL
jgi:predicted ester cyclase